MIWILEVASGPVPGRRVGHYGRCGRVRWWHATQTGNLVKPGRHGNLPVTQFSELVTEMMMMVTVRRPLGPAGLGLARDA